MGSALLLAGLILLPRPTDADSPLPSVERARYIMGTICTATVHARDTTTAARAIEAGFDEIAHIERVISTWLEDSDVSRMNATAADTPFTARDELYEVLAAARTVAETTDGAYDPTIAPLIDAWDLRGDGRVPGDAEIATARARTGWKGLLLDSGTMSVAFARPGMGVDLGGIGKGFALDHAVVAIQLAGGRRGMLNFGGEIVTWSDGGDWNVVIADPVDRLRSVMRVMVSDAAVSTSGQSERGFEAKGKRYGHILNPRTGRPVESSGSVTVIAPSATQADALSTALFVMGRQDAGVFARRHPGIGVIWFEQTGDGLLAWVWNRPDAQPEQDITVHYMDQPAD